jgi:hypothetical protein
MKRKRKDKVGKTILLDGKSMQILLDTVRKQLLKWLYKSPKRSKALIAECTKVGKMNILI